MRLSFRVSCAKQLTELTQLIAKFAGTSDLYWRFDGDRMLICAQRRASGSAQAWAQLHVAGVFSDYKLESKEGNVIILRFSPAASIAHALQPAVDPTSRVSSASFRLRRSRSGERVGCGDLYVEFASEGHALSFAIPCTPVSVHHPEVLLPKYAQPAIRITLPPLKEMKAVVDRLRAGVVSRPNEPTVVTLTAAAHGALETAVAGDGAVARAAWGGLVADELRIAQGESAAVDLDVAVLAGVLAAHSVAHEAASVRILPGELAVVQLAMWARDATLLFILPAVRQ